MLRLTKNDGNGAFLLNIHDELPKIPAKRNTESFGKWTREAAEATGAYFIDLNKISADKLEKKGVKKAATYYNHDHTHSSLKGAHMNAKSIVKG